MSSLYQKWRHLWRPRKITPIEQWCDSNLMLPDVGTYLSGPWRSKTFAYQRGILWLMSHGFVEEVALMWAAQLGKTSLIAAILCWIACNNPAPAMLATVDEIILKRFYRKTLYPMLEACRATSSLLLPQKSRQFPTVDIDEMKIHGAWAGSTARLGDVSVRYLFINEADKWTVDKSREADAELLARKRINAYPNAKVLIESTPTVMGRSRIERCLNESDVILYYHVPCCECGKYQVLSMEQLDYKRNEKGELDPIVAFDTGKYLCVHCGEEIPDTYRRRMLERGVWAPEGHEVPKDCKSLVLWGDGKPKKRVGTQLSVMYSPLWSWKKIAEQHVLAIRTGDKEKLRDWKNGCMGEAWIETEGAPEWKLIQRRLASQIPRGIVPDWAQWMTAGIDVGGEKCHYVILAWGPGPRVHLVEAEQMGTGENSERILQNTLSEVIERPRKKENGETINVNLVAVDSGWNPDLVMNAVSKYGMGRARAIKGNSGKSQKPWWPSEQTANVRTGKPYPDGQKLFMLGSDLWKGTLNSMLMRNSGDPGALMLHKDATEHLVRCLCNVGRFPREDKKGFVQYEFQRINTSFPEHLYDSACYAVASAEMLGIRLLSGPLPNRRPPQPQRGRKKMNFREVKIRR